MNGNVSGWLEEGMRHYSGGDPARALECWYRVLEVEPQHAAALQYVSFVRKAFRLDEKGQKESSGPILRPVAAAPAPAPAPLPAPLAARPVPPPIPADDDVMPPPMAGLPTRRPTPPPAPAPPAPAPAPSLQGSSWGDAAGSGPVPVAAAAPAIASVDRAPGKPLEERGAPTGMTMRRFDFDTPTTGATAVRVEPTPAQGVAAPAAVALAADSGTAKQSVRFDEPRQDVTKAPPPRSLMTPPTPPPPTGAGVGSASPWDAADGPATVVDVDVAPNTRASDFERLLKAASGHSTPPVRIAVPIHEELAASSTPPAPAKMPELPKIEEPQRKASTSQELKAPAASPSAPLPPPTPAPAPAPPPDECEALMTGAKELFELGDFSGSLELVEKVLKKKPNHEGARAYLKRNEQTLLKMYESKLGDMQKVPRQLVPPDEVIWMNMHHRAGFILSQVDGSLSYDDLLSVSGMDRFDTVRILADLVGNGIIG